MPKVYIRTYGCQMNVRDSEQMARQFQDLGYELTEDEAEADVILLNTCSVRDQAEQKALGNMNRLRELKREKPWLTLGIAGCMAQSRGERLLENLPDVDLVVGTQRIHRVTEQVERIRSHGGGLKVVDVGMEEGSERAIRDHVLNGPRASAFVSIMQGCNLRCSFCIVPAVRGAERSRSIDEIVDEVRQLAAAGVKEVMLLGQVVNFYGNRFAEKKAGETPFVRLLEAVNEVEGVERIRFASPHPLGFRDDLIEAMRRLPKVCEHVHLPAQSGSDRILRLMRRGYTADRYRRLVERLREMIAGVAVTTDLIVGFPGETEAEFQDTVSLAREMEFDQAFVFRYSPRKGTPAAGMPGQLPVDEKRRRNQELLEVVNEVIKRRMEDEAGKEREVLVEGRSRLNPKRMTGRTRQNKIVVFEGDETLTARLVRMRIKRSLGFSLLGETVA
ncbi:MAG: tRNA (N6-isopentenyl adenosine(37)-C2)-methylthiotransferase MiaB [Verrucomicrobiae bacterium]|nr:tRNA (N6-isopentenyl adenosine(37)-C2)-methylthiotransferase MiaB [Verrucomicrobiae bacterium]